MILFKNWEIKGSGELFARQYDHLSRTLLVTGVPDGYDWNMMVQVGGNFDILALSPMEGGVGVVLTANQLSIAGYYKLQLVGTLRSDGVTKRHTNVLQVYVPGSLSGDANWPSVPSEFSQVEANLRELNSHPPIPGDNGYWMTWDLESHSYTESEFPLPEVTTGPQGPQGETGAPGNDGADGVSPAVSVTDITGGHRVTITDANGEKAFDVMDGAAGPEGPRGEAGPQGPAGPQGEAGSQGPAGADGLGLPAATADDAGKVPVVQADASYGLGRMIPAPETAEVGQTIVVKAVDESGKPTEWEVADIPSEWEIINEITTAEEVSGITISTDLNGNAYELDEIKAVLTGSGFNESKDWYAYPNNTAKMALLFNFPANSTLVYHYKRGNGAAHINMYRYGYQLYADSCRCRVEPVDDVGKFVAQPISQFRLASFTGGVIPANTHVLVLGRRVKA